MKRIAYLLNRFPRVTDTFITRELKSLQQMGTEVKIISVWNPQPTDIKSEFLDDRPGQVEYLLPQPVFSILRKLLAATILSPKRFAAVLRLAFVTSRPGLRGIVYQLFYLAEAMLAADRLRKLEISHVHNHFGDHTGLVTMFACKLAGAEYSISFHGPHVFFNARNEALKQKVRDAQFIRCISYFCRSQVIAFSQCPDPTALKVVHCGLDLSHYQFRPPRERLRKAFCAARLAPEKGIEYLIEALALLIDRAYDIDLRIAGDGPSRAKLDDLARRLGISDHVTFLGNVGEQEVTSELSEADIFILPSVAEGVSVSLMEAFAIGVPVVATNIAGTSELVDHRRTGLLVRPSDPQALADAVVWMMENYSFRLSAAELGRKKVTEEFDIDKQTVVLNGHLL